MKKLIGNTFLAIAMTTSLYASDINDDPIASSSDELVQQATASAEGAHQCPHCGKQANEIDFSSFVKYPSYLSLDQDKIDAINKLLKKQVNGDYNWIRNNNAGNHMIVNDQAVGQGVVVGGSYVDNNVVENVNNNDDNGNTSKNIGFRFVSDLINAVKSQSKLARELSLSKDGILHISSVKDLDVIFGLLKLNSLRGPNNELNSETGLHYIICCSEEMANPPYVDPYRYSITTELLIMNAGKIDSTAALENFVAKINSLRGVLHYDYNKYFSDYDDVERRFGNVISAIFGDIDPANIMSTLLKKLEISDNSKIIKELTCLLLKTLDQHIAYGKYSDQDIENIKNVAINKFWNGNVESVEDLVGSMVYILLEVNSYNSDDINAVKVTIGDDASDWFIDQIKSNYEKLRKKIMKYLDLTK